MKNDVLAAISSERIIESKLAAVVTEDCVVIKSFSGQPHTVLSLDCISTVKIVKTYHPGLAVVSVGLFLLSAAALASKDGGGTGVPMGILAVGFLFAYLATQKAKVVFMSGSEATQTVNGSFSDVADLVAAVQFGKRNLLHFGSAKRSLPGFWTRLAQWAAGIVSSRIRTISL